MTEPGLDIHEEMLLRLQVKDLMRCKSVCKSWNSLISSDRFIKSQLNYNLNKNTNEIGDTRIIVWSGGTSMCSFDCYFPRKGEFQLVGSSNGLVCITRYYTDFLVVNPSTREVKELKNPTREYNVSGFGYDSSIDDFKVVTGFQIKTKHNDIDKCVFKVLNLKSNFWRTVVVDYLGYFYPDRNGILFNGAIHWISRGENRQPVITSFDLSKEVFKEIPLPKLDDTLKCYLGTMKDRLCVFYFPNRNKIEIQVMRNNNAQVSWERELSPPGYDINKTTMDYYPKRRFLSGNVHIWLLEEGSGFPVLVGSIDHPDEYRHEHIRLSTYSECNYNYDEHVFVKSLVSPHGTGDGDGDGGDDNINDVISLSTLFM